MLKQSEPVAKILKSIVGQPAFWATMGFAFFLYAGLGFVSLINVYLLTELGWGRDPGLMQAYGVTNLLERLGGVLGALLVMRIPNHYLTSTRFYALAILAFWVLTAPWLLVMRQPEQVGLAYLARATEGMGAGIISTLFLALIMRLSQPSLEGFTFNLLGTAASLGERVLGTNLVAFMAVPLGGLAPAFFTLIPFSLVSLVFLAPVLTLLRANASLAPQAAPEPGFSG